MIAMAHEVMITISDERPYFMRPVERKKKMREVFELFNMLRKCY